MAAVQPNAQPVLGTALNMRSQVRASLTLHSFAQPETCGHTRGKSLGIENKKSVRGGKK